MKAVEKITNFWIVWKATKNRHLCKVSKDPKRVDENREIYSRGCKEGPDENDEIYENDEEALSFKNYEKSHKRVENREIYLRAARKGSTKTTKFTKTTKNCYL